MKKSTSLFFALLLALTGIQADDLATCNGKIVGNNNNENTAAYLAWGTLEDGTVLIRIFGANGDMTTAFRGDGMQRDGFFYQSGSMTGPELLRNYFDASMNSERTEIRWKPKNTTSPQAGDRITFISGKNIEWKTEANSNVYHNKYAFSYSYGDNCSRLATPSVTSVTEAGVVTFAAVANADAYMAHIYQGDALLKSQMIENGGTLDFVSYSAGSYAVRLQALGWSGEWLNSELSAPVTWTPVAHDISSITSEYCSEPIGSGNTQAFLTWTTDADGNVVISITGDEGTAFRGGNGMNDNNLGKFTAGGVAASTYFERAYNGDNSTAFILRLKNGVTLALGTKIKYNSGTVEWKTAADGNCFGTFTFEYTYGAKCPSLDAPVIRSITGKVISFDPVEGAESYSVAIYRGDFKVYSQTGVTNGGTIDFAPFVESDYLVYLTAEAADLQPATSEAYGWHVAASGADIPMSEVCSSEVSAADGGILLSIETGAEGQIILTLSGENHPTWRGGGIQVDMLYVYGVKLQNYFNKQGNYERKDTMILTPKNNGIPVYAGDVITYKGNVEWYVTVNQTEKASYAGGYAFQYIYGSVCTASLPRLEAPVIRSISDAGVIRFEAVADAAAYQAFVYDADEELVAEPLVTDGGTIEKGASVIDGFTYTVYLQALAAEGSTAFRDSPLSEPYLWTPQAAGTGLEQVIAGETPVTVYAIDGTVVMSGVTMRDVRNAPAATGTQIYILRDKNGHSCKLWVK